MTHDTFSAEDWQKELDAAISAQAQTARQSKGFCPPPEQAYYIVAARDAGVEWDTIMAYCKSRGWSGAESTLLKFYREQKGK